MTVKGLFAAFLLTAPAALSAQHIGACDPRAALDAIPEPWSDNTRSFANGAVRLALIDVIEPAAIPYYLVVLHPPYDDMGARRCTMIGFAKETGYQVLFFSDIEAGYDPAQGLMFSIPGRLYDAPTGFSNGLILDVVVNQATGQVSATHRLGRE